MNTKIHLFPLPNSVMASDLYIWSNYSAPFQKLGHIWLWRYSIHVHFNYQTWLDQFLQMSYTKSLTETPFSNWKYLPQWIKKLIIFIMGPCAHVKCIFSWWWVFLQNFDFVAKIPSFDKCCPLDPMIIVCTLVATIMVYMLFIKWYRVIVWHFSR